MDQYNPISGVMLGLYNPTLGVRMNQYNPIPGVMLAQCNPIFGVIMDQNNPIPGVEMGFIKAILGFGRTFPVWENPTEIPRKPPKFTIFNPMWKM